MKIQYGPVDLRWGQADTYDHSVQHRILLVSLLIQGRHSRLFWKLESAGNPADRSHRPQGHSRELERSDVAFFSGVY